MGGICIRCYTAFKCDRETENNESCPYECTRCKRSFYTPEEACTPCVHSFYAAAPPPANDYPVQMVTSLLVDTHINTEQRPVRVTYTKSHHALFDIGPDSVMHAYANLRLRVIGDHDGALTVYAGNDYQILSAIKTVVLLAIPVHTSTFLDTGVTLCRALRAFETYAHRLPLATPRTAAPALLHGLLKLPNVDPSIAVTPGNECCVESRYCCVGHVPACAVYCLSCCRMFDTGCLATNLALFIEECAGETTQSFIVSDRNVALVQPERRIRVEAVLACLADWSVSRDTITTTTRTALTVQHAHAVFIAFCNHQLDKESTIPVARDYLVSHPDVATLFFMLTSKGTTVFFAAAVHNSNLTGLPPLLGSTIPRANYTIGAEVARQLYIDKSPAPVNYVDSNGQYSVWTHGHGRFFAVGYNPTTSISADTHYNRL